VTVGVGVGLISGLTHSSKSNDHPCIPQVQSSKSNVHPDKEQIDNVEVGVGVWVGV
jgi:hypothetical protein